jgi:hypothetical protein
LANYYWEDENHKKLESLGWKFIIIGWSIEDEELKGCWRHNPLIMIRNIFDIHIVHQEEAYILK